RQPSVEAMLDMYRSSARALSEAGAKIEQMRTDAKFVAAQERMALADGSVGVPTTPAEVDASLATIRENAAQIGALAAAVREVAATTRPQLSAGTTARAA